MSLSICVPVLKRYDLLQGMMLSLSDSTVIPTRFLIVDNGRDKFSLRTAIEGVKKNRTTTIEVFTPNAPMGVAASWNWFLEHTPEERIITNDDVLFKKDSLEKILASKADLVWASGFSCFCIRDACVGKLGLFDEKISPGYGYYEDDDYLQRLDGRGTRPPSAIAENVEAGVIHLKSQTLQAMSHEEVLEHHRKFKIAQVNYVRKYPQVGKDFPEVML